MQCRLFSLKVVCCCLMLTALDIASGRTVPLAFGAEPQAEQTVADATPAKPNDSAAVDCRQLADMLQQQKSLISREIGQVKREIAALRDDTSRPGIREVFAGIGYIFGLAGVGLYVHCRKNRGQC
jgi:hypothetical protein